jgi:osmotically-inducible protein OsmY
MNASTAFAIFCAVVVAVVVLSRLRPRGPAAEADAELTSAVDAAIRAIFQREFPTAVVQIDVKSFGGKVILGGYVREFAQSARAVEIAGSAPGVREVDNRLTIRSDG